MKRYVDSFDGFSLNESREPVAGMMPPGRYWIGDLCYVLGDKWEEVCDLMISGDDIIDGEVFRMDDGTIFTVLSTEYGDGTYTDQYGNEYPVDAGLIGAVKTEDITDPKAHLDYGKVVTFNNEWDFYRENGVLTFGDIEINTGDEEEDEEDEDDFDEDY